VAATADGYTVSYGDAANLRLVDAIGASHARAVVLGAPNFEISRAITPTVQREFPDIERYVSLDTVEDVTRFKGLGIHAFLSAVEPHGVEMAADLLRSLDVSDEALTEWLRDQSERFNTDDIAEVVVEPTDKAA